MSVNGASGEAPDGGSDRVWFISHAGADRAWAEWIACQLLKAGHEIELDYWDWGAGDNFVLKMNAALERGRFLALFSPAYFEPERFTTPEWTAMVAKKAQITPVCIARTTPPAILSSLVAPDLFGLDDQAAREALLRAVEGPSRPDRAPLRPPGMPAGVDAPAPGDSRSEHDVTAYRVMQVPSPLDRPEGTSRLREGIADIWRICPECGNVFNPAEAFYVKDEDLQVKWIGCPRCGEYGIE